MKHQEIAKVLSNTKVAPEHYLITLLAPKIAAESLPGQFIMAKCSDSTDPLLRRPLSLNTIDRKQGSIGILFRVVGNGTRMISELEPGEDKDVLGPMGNGFNIKTDKEVAILVGGGVGIAPLLSLAKELKGKVKIVYALIGANNIEGVLCEKEFKALGCEVAVSTDDGTYGNKGLITDVLLELLDSQLTDLSSVIYACGPRLMIKALDEISVENKVPCQASLEEWMGCGFGSCNGCTVITKQGNKKVCSDGPIFDIKDLVWQK